MRKKLCQMFPFEVLAKTRVESSSLREERVGRGLRRGRKAAVCPGFDKACRVLIFLSALVLPVNAAEFWVSPNGDDSNAGTQESPVASVAVALRGARELRRLNQVPTNEAVRIV